MPHQMGKTFTLFRNLPPEARLMIWDWANPPGRIIEIDQVERSVIREKWNLVPDHNPGQTDYEEDEHGDLIRYSRLWGFKSNAPIPALLACHESHGVASKWYPQVFQCSNANIGPGILGMAVEPDFSRVENLAVEIDSEWLCWDTQVEWLAKVLERTFCNLKTLTIVVEYCVLSPRWRKWLGVKMTAEDEADLVFMKELIDVQYTYHFYQPGRPILQHEKEQWVEPKANVSDYTEKRIRRLTRALMAILREERIAHDGKEWNLPTIAFKIVVPWKVKAALKQNIHQCKEKFHDWQRQASSGLEQIENIQRIYKPHQRFA
ncbi:hypothetical protein OCU04_002556 [Sclerotinia nivalis]|uniref:2EXR domain-containing protein n=1 Tax=Sclerotinia nivalis TaxID=352851 RepID=A0A9X0ATV7_9HELO|nr:hypothetical protein OCU04_002556 [Sclerotinia nivalis]